MSNEDRKAAVCKETLATLPVCGSIIVPQLRVSLEIQLNWLIYYFEGRTGERKQLSDLTSGYYAAREIDPREKELIDALNKAYNVAVKTREGLKIDLKLLGCGS